MLDVTLTSINDRTLEFAVDNNYDTCTLDVAPQCSELDIEFVTYPIYDF